MMKSTKLLSLMLLICLLLTCTSCNIFNTDTSTTADTQNTTVSSAPDVDNNDSGSSVNVIMLNDNHGILTEDNWNLDKIASGINYYDSIGETVKIANGDMFQGTYVSSTLRGLPMLDALNAMDFDAFVIGNHEFDWGFDEIKKYKDGDLSNGEADFPFLGANIYDKSTNAMVDWLEPYTIVECDEITIGIIGIIGDVETSILSTHVKDYDFVDAKDIVKDLASELRTVKGCDAVIVAIHGDDDSLNATFATYTGNSRIDGIFTGHSHIPTDEEIKRADGTNICVLQNGGYGDSFATLLMEFDKNGNLTDTDGKLNKAYRFASNGILAPVFEKYEDELAIGETVLMTIDQSVSRYDAGITVAHSMYIKYNTDFAVINAGGVRTSISAGEVTYADIFQVLPFENEIYIVTLSGALLKSYLDNSISNIYYWGIDINSINDYSNYQLAIIDYVYLSDAFKNYRNDSCIDTNDLVRDVFIDFIKPSAE